LFGNKIKSSEEAVALIKDGDTVAINGFIGFGHPEELLSKLKSVFLKTGKPKNLTLVHSAGQGDNRERCMNHYGHPGLTKRVICGHIGLAPKLVSNNLAEGYAFPQGVVAHLFRAVADGRRAGSDREQKSLGLNTSSSPPAPGCFIALERLYQ